jgi:ankyrin repeat protein
MSMSDSDLIEVVKAGQQAAAKTLIEGGADVNQQDEQGWTPLNFAAGRGDLPMAKLLVDKGADPFKVGRDNRTPYMIALAAGQVEMVEFLRAVEDETDMEKANSFRPDLKYCKAYRLKQLRESPYWLEKSLDSNGGDEKAEQAKESGLTDDKVVFIHQDFTVTGSVWHNEHVIFDQVSESWRDFCATVLGFRVPTDLDLIVPSSKNNS